MFLRPAERAVDAIGDLPGASLADGVEPDFTPARIMFGKNGKIPSVAPAEQDEPMHGSGVPLGIDEDDGFAFCHVRIHEGFHQDAFAEAAGATDEGVGSAAQLIGGKIPFAGEGVTDGTGIGGDVLSGEVSVFDLFDRAPCLAEDVAFEKPGDDPDDPLDQFFDQDNHQFGKCSKDVDTVIVPVFVSIYARSF